MGSPHSKAGPGELLLWICMNIRTHTTNSRNKSGTSEFITKCVFFIYACEKGVREGRGGSDCACMIYMCLCMFVFIISTCMYV